MIEENLTAVPADNEEELKEEERKLETEQQIDEAVAEQGGGQQMPPNMPQPGINIDPNIIPQIAQGANNISGNLQQAMYHMDMYKKGIKRWPHRKSGVRFLSVPKL